MAVEPCRRTLLVCRVRVLLARLFAVAAGLLRNRGILNLAAGSGHGIFRSFARLTGAALI